jgi:DNA-binding Lrp family transcriptional regulator
MQRQIILSFVPLVDHSKLGYEFFYVFIKFGTLVKKRDLFVDRVKKNGHVVAVTRVIGEYDYELQVIAKDTQQLYATVNNLLLPVKKDVSRMNVINASSFYLYSMQIGKHNEGIRPSKKIVRRSNHMDQMDVNILKKLSLNARESFVSLAKALKTTPENIRYHLKKLIESGIILSFHARTNKHALGLNTYIFLLDITGNLTPKDLSFLKEKENIYYIRKCAGQWNIIINFYAENNAKLAETLETIRDHFKANLNTYELLILLDRYKFVPVPENIAINKTA